MNEAQAQQTRIIEGRKRDELRQQEGIAQAQQLDYQSAHNDAIKWREEFNSARCYLELEKKVEELEAAARFWQDKYGRDIADTSAGDTGSPIQKLVHSLEQKLAVAVRDMEIESLRLRNEELELQIDLALNIAENRRNEIESLRARNDKLNADLINERILRYAAEAERNAETERCAKIAREYPLSPVVDKAIAALIMEGRK